MTDCIFCKIVAGELPSYKIYENDRYLAFLDIFPLVEGHCMVIPKDHVEWVWDYDSPGEYFELVTKIARHYRKITGEGVRSNIYGWEVPHAHIHIKPGRVDTRKPEQMIREELVKIQAQFTML